MRHVKRKFDKSSLISRLEERKEMESKAMKMKEGRWGATSPSVDRSSSVKSIYTSTLRNKRTKKTRDLHPFGRVFEGKVVKKKRYSGPIKALHHMDISNNRDISCD
jgi:hypothetical protein